MALRIRLRGPAGKQHSASMPTAATISDLCKEAATVFSIAEGEIEILLGFPPSLCTADSSALLDGLIRSGDSIIVRRGTGEPPVQAMSSDSLSAARRRTAMPAPGLRARQVALPPPVATHSGLAQVNLFWKIAVDDVRCLNDAVPYPCGHLQMVSDLFVCLLFFGGRTEAKAAEKVELPLREFRRIHKALSAHAGEKVSFSAHTIYIDRDIVFATLSLPDDIPHHQGPGRFPPCLTFRVSPTAPGNMARVVFARGKGATRIDLPQPLFLSGTIQLETATPNCPSQRVREIRLATEMQGRWVQVKKHSSMSCAVITFPSGAVRNSVLQKCSDGQSLRICGELVDVKPHWGKRLDGSRGNVPESLFVAWRQLSGYGNRPITADTLQYLFDQQTDLFMNMASLNDNANVADALLRGNAGTSARLDDGLMVSLDDVMVLRLTRMSRSAEVTSLLLNSPVLEDRRLQMAAAGYDITPSWACGAKLFVPLDESVMIEAGIKLDHFHIIAYSCDVELLKQALSTIPCRQRPKLVEEQQLVSQEHPGPQTEQLFVVECTLRTNSSFGTVPGSDA